jgi:hypothetical protein
MGKGEIDGEVNMIKGHFMYYESGIMKFAKNCKKKKGGDKECNKRMNLIKVHYKHIQKYHNETPLYN